MPKVPRRRKSGPIITGQLDPEGRLHGRGTEKFPSGDVFRGRYCHGDKHGRGAWIFADGSMLMGIFSDDELDGLGTYRWPDGSEMIAHYRGGQLWGPSTKVDCDGDLVSSGSYIDSVRTGRWFEVVDSYGAFLLGTVSSDGEWTGDGIAYVYPDKRTALFGNFKGGVLFEAVEGTCEGQSIDMYSVQPGLDEVNQTMCLSTHDKICDHPLKPDPYEAHTAFVAKSSIPDAGEGLFAKRPLHAGELVAYYNGVRLSHAIVDGRAWSENGNCISLDEEVVIDVPEVFSNTSVYCATLGHKANHSFAPNSCYAPCYHPLYGDIKCIHTIKPVDADEEITVHYDYHHQSDNAADESAPDWYLASKLAQHVQQQDG